MKLKRKHGLRGLIAVTATFAGLGGLLLAQATPALADPIVQYTAVGSDTVQDVYNQFSADFGSSTVNGISATTLGSYNATNPVTQTVGEDITPVDGVDFVNPQSTTEGFTPATVLVSGGASCAFVRPNGSGGGLAALEYSMGDHTVASHLTAGNVSQQDLPAAGCVDISRSSGAPGTVITGQAVPSTNPPDETVQFIPFAVDAVTGATGPTSGASGTITAGTVTAPIVNTVLSTGVGNGTNLFTVAQLTSLYDQCQEVTVGTAPNTITYWPYDGTVGAAYDQPAGTQRIDLYIPQLGSGTEKFWATATGGWSSSAPPSCVFHTVQNGPLADSTHTSLTGTNGADCAAGAGAGPLGGFANEEHDGTDVSTDPCGYAPFSIAQYYAQSVNNIDPRFHEAVLDEINSTPPFNASGTLNTSFPIQREVYSVVDQARIASTSGVQFTPADFDANLNAMVVGSTSRICKDKLEIQFYGFALFSSGLAGTQPGDLCGEVLASNSENY